MEVQIDKISPVHTCATLGNGDILECYHDQDAHDYDGVTYDLHIECQDRVLLSYEGELGMMHEWLGTLRREDDETSAIEKFRSLERLSEEREVIAQQLAELLSDDSRVRTYAHDHATYEAPEGIDKLEHPYNVVYNAYRTCYMLDVVTAASSWKWSRLRTTSDPINEAVEYVYDVLATDDRFMNYLAEYCELVTGSNGETKGDEVAREYYWAAHMQEWAGICAMIVDCLAAMIRVARNA